MIRAFRNNSGFSLIELALVVAIVGLVATALLGTYRNYIRTKINNDTAQHRNLIQDSIANFLTNYDRLPCPADPTLPPSSPNAGREVLPCTSGAPQGAVLIVPGHRKTSSAPATTWKGYEMDTTKPTYGEPCGNCSNPSINEPITPFDPVMIGTVPYATLGISVRDSLDGYGNRFTYAVSQYLTNAATFQIDNGVIDVLHLEKQELPVGSGNFGNVLVATNKSVSSCPLGSHATCNSPNPAAPIRVRRGAIPYIIVSHGRDGKGAYNYYGQRVVACGATPGRDNENCDDDRTFVDADPKTGIFTTVHAPETAPGTDPDVYFDDTVASSILGRSKDKWTFSATKKIYNKSKGRVGIGLTAPQAELDVDGNILTGRLLANQFCSPEWDNPATTAVTPDKPELCFNSKMIAGPDGSKYGADRAMGCPDKLVTGIAGGLATCDTAGDLRVLTGTNCTGANKYVIGITSTGAFVCAP